MKIHEVAGDIMTSLEAFHRSRPSMDTSQMLIVRGMSRKNIKPEELDSAVYNVLNEIGARKIDVFSDEAKDIIGVMDEYIRLRSKFKGILIFMGFIGLKNHLRQ